MATAVNLTKVGGLVKVDITGASKAYDTEYVNPNTSFVSIKYNSTSHMVQFSVGNINENLADITAISVAGSAATSQADFETKIATIF